MILAILALAWVAFLAPVVVRKVREMGSDRSIDHFHAEHEVLSRQGYAVEPAYRLEEPVRVAYPGQVQEHYSEQYAERPVRERTSARPRLTVVQDGDTYSSLESRQSWEEWSEDYDFDRGEPSRAAARPRVSAQQHATNRYVTAYSSVPREMPVGVANEPLRPARSMRRRRRVMLTRLALATVLVTGAAFISGVSLIFDVAMLTWLADVAYVAIALFALSQGYLAQSSVGLARAEEGLAPVQPLRRDRDDDGGRGVGYGYDYYEDDDTTSDSGWAHASPARYALG
jgi:hypothetical protein